ncbi:TM0106 family RecB-like putative nuclease [Hoyosella rhizosphaerae]|nr:bifunctional RecB family nuclease/DEAD/DEAH box helicase [Hoyosella rhizosphaerae]MBN4926773.1 TM0106 family RecB-like putative nuclease [Hoyosella rhizosphaerae]
MLDIKLGRWDAPAVADDAMMARAAELGDEHEQRMLDSLIAKHGDGVVQLQRPAFTESALIAAREATLDAIRQGAPVIFQGTFYDGHFAGFCDFLLREVGLDGQPTYAVYDTKLSRHARVTALLQLAAYADQLLSSGVAVAPHVHLVLGDGTVTNHQLADVLPVYRQRRARLDFILREHLAEAAPVQWGDPRYSINIHSDLVADHLIQTRDPILIAGLTTVQRTRLFAANIRTIDDVAELSPGKPVSGISAPTLARLQAQAEAQLIEERTGKPHFSVYNPHALTELPAPSAGDVFFDFEGDPLWTEGDSPDWGLEYLFGLVEAPDGTISHTPDVQTTFVAFWAHDRAQEKQALRDFIAYIGKRREQYPDMHIYHYAPYEKTALRRLAGRHGVCETEVDELLRANVLIDLYPLVRKALRIGKPSYSIKKLEPLYMGDHLRGGDVTTAGDSIVEYAHYTDLVRAGDHTAAAAVLNSIADYNRYDCDSTLHLRNWLAHHAADHGIALRHREMTLVDDVPDNFDDSELERALLELTEDIPRHERSDPQQAAAMMAAALNYHWRERKPFWWGHFDRLSATDGDLVDSNEAFVVDKAVTVQPWEKPTPRSNYCRYVHVTGEIPPGSGLGEGKDVFALYQSPPPEGIPQPVPEGRGVGRNAKLLSEDECNSAGIRYPDHGAIVWERLPKGVEPFDDIPVAFTPGSPPATKSLEQALAEAGEQFVDSWPTVPATAGIDVLLRSAPRTKAGRPPATVVAHDTATAIVTTLRNLADSYVAVQGPPGTGKTFTGSRVIAELVNNHAWKVGVVAQSHSVVENMLDGIVDAGVAGTAVFKGENRLKSDKWSTTKNKNDIAALIDAAHDGIVVGGTAWAFSNTNQIPAQSLDLLVIDEAGQFSLANTLAVAGSARNLLLLGDPQQLPQVSQGTHPEPVDHSALGWLIGQRGTLPEGYGYFLERTFRMHPALCKAVSTLSYEGRLYSEESVTTARHLEGVAPGVRTIMVDHHGNSTSSIEEAEAVRDTIIGLLGKPWTEKGGEQPRPLNASDVIVVAPYNAQVETIAATLKAAGLAEVMVGTVDKFQGRQAAVAIVSMTASAVEDVPRGMGFLMSRNRLNVAVSRGQWLAIVVRSHALTDFMPTTPEGLEELGAFLALCDVGAN